MLQLDEEGAVVSVFGVAESDTESFTAVIHQALSDEDRERIWEKFYKTDKSHSREYGGSGIGLSIVKAIVENHGGKCGVDNTDNGVSFYFTIEKA